MSDWDRTLDELLEDESDTMTAWEVEFIESVNKQRARVGEDWLPSTKQKKVLVDIWNKVFDRRTR